MKKILTKKGFTLIELIVVIAILAILAAILIPSIINYIDEANGAKLQANARSEYSRVMLSHATTNGVPTLPNSTTAMTSATPYTLADNTTSCTTTFTTVSISAFSCTTGTGASLKTVTLAGNFQVSP
ncbi:MAG TPA: type IV pilin [Erysipelotrichaceae bacterium]|nr:type IV pilin [Erysipelotrichaceae bacterium]